MARTFGLKVIGGTRTLSAELSIIIHIRLLRNRLANAGHLIVRPRLHDRLFLVAIGFFLGRVSGHRIFLAARLHDEFSSLQS